MTPRTRETPERPLTAALPALLCVSTLYLLSFLARTILAPLLPAVRAELGLGHAASGELYLLLGSGIALGLLSNSLVASFLDHRRAAALSAVSTGAALLWAAASGGMESFRCALFAVGLGAGLYLPSGVAIVTATVRTPDWGKALALHELAPNLSFALAPLLAEAMLHWLSWRAGLVVLGALEILAGLAFLTVRLGVGLRGRVPGPGVLRGLLREPAFWAVVCAFGLAVSASFGTYSMSTLYMVDRGIPRPQANGFLSLARLAALFAALGAGWVTDRLGPTATLRAYFLGMGTALASLGLAPTTALPWLLVCEAVCSVFFFPACVAALSRAFPGELRSLTLSLAVPLGLALGLGGVPVALGAFGDAGIFGLGFVLLGGLVCCGLLLPSRLRPRLARPGERG
ncbi:MFS transporter [Desulfovibrio aminophilus]|uniref:MFS transporter n=1 Tax=Desulfovibrio aminophilus TaxID=81425 RepID=UPI0033923A8B